MSPSPTPQPDGSYPGPNAPLDQVQHAYAALRRQVGQVVVGQDRVIEQVITAIFCGGHALLVGVPGLAKTLLVSTIARTLNLQFSRIQFTPDLMPGDITGTELIQEDRATGQRALRFVKGPVFSNVILADEINRAPPKTQAALLEAMQEHQVTAGRTQYPLPKPFFVLATQNPIDQEGTYPLPEAQLDRFMFMIQVDYPSETEEFQIVRRTTSRSQATVDHVLTADEVVRIADLVRDVPVADHVIAFALKLVRATRPADRQSGDPARDWLGKYLTWGAGPRASQCLILAGKARAALQGRPHVSTEDIRAVAHPVLRHRLITSFNAEADGVGSDEMIDRLLAGVAGASGSSSDLDAVLR